MKRSLFVVGLLLSSILFGATHSSPIKPDDAKRLCQYFHQKSITYQKQMRNDALAKRTLQSYKERKKRFCAMAKQAKGAKL